MQQDWRKNRDRDHIRKQTAHTHVPFLQIDPNSFIAYPRPIDYAHEEYEKPITELQRSHAVELGQMRATSFYQSAPHVKHAFAFAAPSYFEHDAEAQMAIRNGHPTGKAGWLGESPNEGSIPGSTY